MITNNELIAGASALAAVFITNLPVTNAIGSAVTQGPKPVRDVRNRQTRACEFTVQRRHRLDRYKVIAGWFAKMLSTWPPPVSRCPLPQGYPPLSGNSYFDSNENKVSCTFAKDGKAKSWDFRVNFGVYLTENGLQTESIRCPKFEESDAFEATYSESAVLRRYLPIYPKGPKHSFDRHPPPANTGQDPIKGMRLGSEGSLNGLYAIAKREGFQTTGGLVSIDDKRKAKIHDLHDVTEAIEKLEETCGELLNTVKKQYPSLDKLCFEYDGITKETVKAVGEGNWRTRDGSKEYRPKK